MKTYSFNVLLPPKLAAFSLIEVIISFTILSGLGIALLQSQFSSSRLLINTEQSSFIRQLGRDTLQQYEISPPPSSFTEQTGKFDDEFPLQNATWTLSKSDVDIFNIPMTKLTYKISWEENGLQKSISDFILIENPLPSIDALLGN